MDPVKKKYRFLLLTYHFPPSNEIGSRRWAKFAKYLQQNGHTVTVLCTKPGIFDKSPWDEDTAGLRIIQYDKNYPEILDEKPHGLWSKFRYHLAIFGLKKRVVGTIYDRAVFLQKEIVKRASEIIVSDKIDVLITNGPPHRLMYYGTLLKQKFPHLFLISDFRDPWTWWYNMGYRALNEKNKKAEERMERLVATQSDLITVPADEMKVILTQKYTHANVAVLPHGFDPDDTGKRRPGVHRDQKSLRLIYLGNLYNGEESRYHVLAKCLKENPHVSLDIFSDSTAYSGIFDQYRVGTQVQYKTPLPSKEIFELIKEYDYFLWIMPDKFRNIFSSKFYEILAAGVPILLICQDGDFAMFLKKNSCGYHITDDNLPDRLNYFFRNPGEFQFGNFSCIDSFSIDKLTETLLIQVAELTTVTMRDNKNDSLPTPAARDLA